MMQKSTLLISVMCLLYHLTLQAQQSTINMYLPQIDLGCITNISEIPKPDPEKVRVETSCVQRHVAVEHVDDYLVDRPCGGTLHRIYRATDECKGEVQDTQEFKFIKDTLDPIRKWEIDLGCNPDLKEAIPDPMKFDLGECLRDYKWLGDEREVDGCRKTLIRKYEVYPCHDPLIFVYCYTWIEDKEPPILTCPANVHFGCDFSGLPVADPNEVQALDNCCLDSVWWGGDIIVSDFDTCEHTIIRRYWAVDCCGNTAYCDQVFNWYSFPNDPVIISCPPGADLGCNIDPLKDIPAAAPELVIVDEACGQYEVSSQMSDVTVFGCEYSITRTYLVKDECGNESACYQTFTWYVDEQPPTILTCPANIDLGCNPESTTFDLISPDYGIEAEDNCGIASIERVRTSEVEQLECDRFYYIYYEITDHCGNTETCKQRVSWKEDNIPPSIECPKDIHLGCNPAAIPPPDPSSIDAKDNCCLAEVIWLYDVIVENADTCEQMRLRKYQAIDCCGNTTICEQIITWTSDSEAPVITDCPAGWDLGCNIDLQSDLPPATPELIAAQDACSEVEVEAHLSDITIFGCEYAISWIYIVSDACGNETQCLQTFTWIVDEDPPIVDKCPNEVDLGCNPDRKEFDLVSPDFGIVAHDNCGVKSIKRVATGDVQKSENCERFYLITYEIADHCGNAIHCTQKVFWKEDTVPPMIICPPDLDLGCNPEVIPEPDPSLVEADDDCCLQSVDMTASSIFMENGFFKITRTYTATDCCGNQSSCDQMILWREQPDVLHYIACPTDIDFGCVRVDPEIPEPIADTPYGGEACPSLFTNAGDNIVQVTPCEYELTRTYLFITCCGDTTPCYQTFEWQWVNTDSVIPVPADQVSFCVVPPLPDFVGNLCGPGVPIFAGQNIIGDCSDGNCTIQRFWNSKGCQGSLYISDMQTIEVVCQLAPVGEMDDTEDPKIENLTVYPNPATDMLNLDFKNLAQIGAIRIFDLQGRMIKQVVPGPEKIQSYQLPINELTPGIYQLDIDGSEHQRKRFVKL